MKGLFLFVLILSGITSGADIYTAEYTRHIVREDGPLKLRLVARDVVTDGCNSYGLYGNFRRVEVTQGLVTSAQDYVADFGVFATELACGEHAQPGKVTLETDWFEVLDAQRVSVFAPKDWVLEIRK